MTAVDVGAVLVRLLAVALILSVDQAAELLALGLFETAFLWAESVAKLFLGILLWFLPRVSAALVIPASIRPKQLGELNAPALERAAFGFLGLYLLVWGIVDLLYHFFIVYASNEHETVVHAKAGALATLVQLALGGWLFFGKGSPYESIRRLRQA